MFIAARSPAARVGFANVSALLRVPQLWDQQVDIRGGRVVADLSDYVDVANEEVAQAAPQVESPAPTERSRLKPRTEAVQSAYGRSTSIRAIRSLATNVRSGEKGDYPQSAATMMAALEQVCLLAG